MLGEYKLMYDIHVNVLCPVQIYVRKKFQEVVYKEYQLWVLVVGIDLPSWCPEKIISSFLVYKTRVMFILSGQFSFSIVFSIKPEIGIRIKMIEK